MTGRQALIRSLQREGVRVIFGLPGLQIMDARDSNRPTVIEAPAEGAWFG